MLNWVRQWMQNFVGLIYPELCIACYERHPIKDQLFCVKCSQELTRTNHLAEPDNDFLKHFIGRVEVQRGASLFVYRKNTSIQMLLYQLKYNNKPEIAYQIGHSFAEELIENHFFEGIDLIIPVPIYWKKQQQRGYNQSEMFANGLSHVTEISVNTTTLQKNKATPSQTKKSRADRVDNVKSTFVINDGQAIAGQHILIVDDVLTTGATLEACATLLVALGCKVSMLTIALGRM